MEQDGHKDRIKALGLCRIDYYNEEEDQRGEGRGRVAADDRTEKAWSERNEWMVYEG